MLTLAPICAGDREAVWALLNQSNLTTAGLQDHTDTLFVVRDGVEMVGCAGLEVYGDEALLRSVALVPAYQGKGWGRHLVEATMHQAKIHRVQHLYLLTFTARDFFLHLDFEDLSRDDIPSSVQASAEFSECMCAGATAMYKRLDTL